VYISWYEQPFKTRKASTDVYIVKHERKTEEQKLKKGLFFCLTLVLFGLLDLGTTLVGVTCFGAVEANPVLASIAVANPLVFSGIKLLAVILIGFMFYRAGKVEEAVGNRFLQLSYSFSLVFLTFVVTNNLIVVAKLA
jgi:hypothetical protein